MGIILLVAFFVPSIIAVVRGDRYRSVILGINILILLVEWGFLISYYGFALGSESHVTIEENASALVAAGQTIHGGSMLILLFLHRAFEAVWGATGIIGVLTWAVLVVWAFFGETWHERTV